jgi:micrococcal nuclease
MRWHHAVMVLILWVCSAAQGASVQGVVSNVTDGDSLWLTVQDKPPLQVRLKDIDAPEICQPWGAEAQQALEKLVLKQTVSLRIKGRDSYGRTLATVMLADMDVNRRLVEEGHAWSTRSRWDQGPLVKQERMAKALGRGLHAAGGAVMPRDFRQRHGSCADAQKAPATAPSSAPSKSPQTSALPPELTKPASSSTRFACGGRTHCRHMRSCDEAKYFLKNCPNMKIDGDRDGIPCETQWCHQNG